MQDTREAYTIWVCVDCIHAEVNGEVNPDADCEPLGLLEGQETSIGMGTDDHHEDCDYRNSIYGAAVDRAVEVHDCNLDCEREEFSWARCEGCGSGLGGERHAMTVWGG